MRISPNEIKDVLISGCRKMLFYEDIVNKYIQTKESELKSKGDNLKTEDISFIKEQFEFSKKSFPNFELCQNILKYRFVRDINTSEYYVLNSATRKLELIDKTTISELFETADFKRFESERLKSVKIAYNPEDTDMYFKRPDLSSFEFINTFRPAAWNSDYFYKKVPVPKVDKIPEIYEKYLRNLVSTNESYILCLNYLATAVQPCPRYQPFLCLIGNQGTGKGIFGQIARALAGPDNYAEIGAVDVAGLMKFNSRMENKRIIFLDELHVKTAEDQNELKVLINPFIKIERKGVDAKTVPNFASFMIASNMLGAIDPEATDRRYSFLDMRNVSIKDFLKRDLKGYSNINEYVKELLKPDNIKNLGEFLLNFKVDETLLTEAYKGPYAERLKAAALPDWALALLEQVAPENAGKSVELDKVKELISEKTNSNSVLKMGARKFEELLTKVKGFYIIEYKRVDKVRKYFIKFEEAKNFPELKIGNLDVKID